MKKAMLVGAAMLVTGTSVVQAYELTSPSTAPATPAATAEWTWNGFYAAGFSNPGFSSWGKSDWTNFNVLGPSVSSGAFGNYSADSLLSGSKIGSSWQYGRFSFGAEVGTGTFGPIGSGFCFQCSNKTIDTVTGRAGVKIDDHTQFYLEGSLGRTQ